MLRIDVTPHAVEGNPGAVELRVSVWRNEQSFHYVKLYPEDMFVSHWDRLINEAMMVMREAGLKDMIAGWRKEP